MRQPLSLRQLPWVGGILLTTYNYTRSSIQFCFRDQHERGARLLREQVHQSLTVLLRQFTPLPSKSLEEKEPGCIFVKYSCLQYLPQAGLFNERCVYGLQSCAHIWRQLDNPQYLSIKLVDNLLSTDLRTEVVGSWLLAFVFDPINRIIGKEIRCTRNQRC